MPLRYYYSEVDKSNQYELSFIIDYCDGSIYVSINAANECPIEFDLSFDLPKGSLERLRKQIEIPIKD